MAKADGRRRRVIRRRAPVLLEELTDASTATMFTAGMMGGHADAGASGVRPGRARSGRGADRHPPCAPRRHRLIAWLGAQEDAGPGLCRPEQGIVEAVGCAGAAQGQAGWSQPIVRNKDKAADWHQLAPGGKTIPVLSADNRVAMIVWGGPVRVNIKGEEPFVACKGPEINIPLRLPYSLETVGNEPALLARGASGRRHPDLSGRDHAKQAGRCEGHHLYQTIMSGSDGVYDGPGKPYLEWYKDVVGGECRAGAFIASDHMFVNNIRGKGTPTPPPRQSRPFPYRLRRVLVRDGRQDRLSDRGHPRLHRLARRSGDGGGRPLAPRELGRHRRGDGDARRDQSLPARPADPRRSRRRRLPLAR